MSRYRRIIQYLLNQNTYLNDIFYRYAFSNSTKATENVLANISNFDFYDDITPLKEFRHKVDDGLVYTTKDVNWDNFHKYGIWNVLFSEYVDNKDIATSAIEHGLIFHDDIFGDIRKTGRSSVVTFSDFRKNIIQKKTNIPVFCVGPYIHYAETFYNEYILKSIREKNGKTLIYFPTHSWSGSVLEYNGYKFLNRLRNIAKNFNTVLVNVYWWNINDEIVKILEAEGYKIISCGFSSDINFLKRLKSYLYLSDYAVGDSIGTHVGYCINQNVPFRFIQSDTKHNTVDEGKKTWDNAINTLDKLSNSFINIDNITDEQREICNYYWGNNLIKTPEKIKAIVEISKDITHKSMGFTHFRYKIAKELLKEYEVSNLLKYSVLKESLPNYII